MSYRGKWVRGCLSGILLSLVLQSKEKSIKTCDSPQEPLSVSDVLVSAVMAGKMPIVTVRVQQTEKANSQI